MSVLRHNEKLIRTDLTVSSKLTMIERLGYGFTKIIADAYLALDNLYGVSVFFRYLKPIDPKEGFGYEMIGTGFPKGERALQVGDHLIARIHDQFPIAKKNFNNRFSVRQTYTRNQWILDTEANPEEFMSKQLTAFGSSINNFLGFMMYYLLRNLSKCPQNCTSQTQQQLCPNTQIPEYEIYISDIFQPTHSEQQPIAFYSEGLALEELRAFGGPRQINTNYLADHLYSLRQRLSRHKVTYCPTEVLISHDLSPAVLCVLALQNKIKEVVQDIRECGGKYKLEASGTFMVAPHSVNPSEDLIVIMNARDSMVLESGFPLALGTKNYGFDAASLGVRQVIYVPYVERGEAYVFHKDVLQCIFTGQEINSAEYAEQRVTNIWARLAFTIDLIDMLPAVIISKCTEPCPTGGSAAACAPCSPAA